MISAPVFLEQTCKAIVNRGLEWPRTLTGTNAVQRCPFGGRRSWKCNSSGEWEEIGPDLSKCQSKNWSVFSDPIEVETILGKTIHLYGGDIEPLLNLVAKLTDQFRSSYSETSARYVFYRKGILLMKLK